MPRKGIWNLFRFKEIKEMGVNLRGIHFHCGSGQHGSQSFKQAIEISDSLMNLGRELGHSMDLLDLGGGYPAAHLNDSLIELLKSSENKGYRVVAEPGRHFCQESCHLLLRVIGKRNKMGKTCYHLNDGY
jgi:diaminopimelate decarboxylase